MVDRKWLKYRARDSDVTSDGTFRDTTYDVSDWPTTEEECISYIVQSPFNLMVDNAYNCAKIRFSWDDTKDIIHYGILAYRVDWDWKLVPTHYTKHENELYYVFFDPSRITIDILENVLGNKAYKNITSTSLKQIVSLNELHLTLDGKFRSAPCGIMATVAIAIGIQEMEIAQSVRKEG